MPGKSGPWSVDEKRFIEDNWDTVHYEDIAEKINRNKGMVRKYIEKNFGKTSASKKAQQKLEPAEYNIKKSLVWKELRAQFSTEELKYFLYHWERIVSQFREDILPTEEMQVVDFLRFELLINRLLQQQSRNLLEIQQLEGDLAHAQSIRDTDKANMLSDQINARRAALSSMTSEYQKLYMEKSKTLDKMKATRDSRIQYLESSKESFIGWVKKIISSESFRKEAGEYMEKLRLAMKLEEERLSTPHKYIDGTVEPPLLNIHTVDNEI